MGRLSARFGERRLLLSGLLLVAVGLVVLPIGGHLAMIVAGAGLVSVGLALVSPTSTALLSAVAPADRTATTLGLARSAGGLARGLGPPVAGVLYALLGPSAPFLVSAALSFGALLLVPAAATVAGTERSRATRP